MRVKGGGVSWWLVVVKGVVASCWWLSVGEEGALVGGWWLVAVNWRFSRSRGVHGNRGVEVRVSPRPSHHRWVQHGRSDGLSQTCMPHSFTSVRVQSTGSQIQNNNKMETNEQTYQTPHARCPETLHDKAVHCMIVLFAAFDWCAITMVRV